MLPTGYIYIYIYVCISIYPSFVNDPAEIGVKNQRRLSATAPGRWFFSAVGSLGSSKKSPRQPSQAMILQRSMAKTKPNGPTAPPLIGNIWIAKPLGSIHILRLVHQRNLKTSLNKKSQKILNLEATTFKILSVQKKKQPYFDLLIT